MKKNGKWFGMFLTIGLVVVLISGCATTTTVTQPVALSTEKPEAKPATKQEVVPLNNVKTSVVPEATFLSGKVVETMNASGYTYINLEKDGKRAWFAVPSTEVGVGQEIEVQPGMQMGLFSSRTLNKTFESIVFAPGLVVDPNAAKPKVPLTGVKLENVSEQKTMPSGHPSLDADPKTFAGKATKEQLRKAGITPIAGKVLETMNAGGYTYILIDNGGKNVWGAVPSIEVTVGQELELLPGQTMTNFNSKALNKTFDSVIFSTGAVPVTKQ